VPSTTSAARDERQPIPLPGGQNSPACPKCSGRMWDNRASKRNPKAPDFKCRDRACDGVLWPGQNRSTIPAVQPRQWAERQEPAAAAAEEEQGGPPVTPLRQKYLDLTDFVLGAVKPRYEAHGIDCSDGALAAMAATLFIAETRREGL